MLRCTFYWWINSILTCSFYSYAGFNPRWDEHVSFVISQPDHAIIRFVVYDHDRYVDDFIGYFALPFRSIQEGKSRLYFPSSFCVIFMHYPNNENKCWWFVYFWQNYKPLIFRKYFTLTCKIERQFKSWLDFFP